MQATPSARILLRARPETVAEATKAARAIRAATMTTIAPGACIKKGMNAWIAGERVNTRTPTTTGDVSSGLRIDGMPAIEMVGHLRRGSQKNGALTRTRKSTSIRTGSEAAGVGRHLIDSPILSLLY